MNAEKPVKGGEGSGEGGRSDPLGKSGMEDEGEEGKTAVKTAE